MTRKVGFFSLVQLDEKGRNKIASPLSGILTFLAMTGTKKPSEF
jgi:hypothetical protein